MPTRRALLALLAGASAALPSVDGLAQPGTGRMAPDFLGLDGWLNTAAPLTTAGLRGQVALVNFWTYSCINCIRTFPYLKRWQAEYGARGLRMIGVHTPEFGFEHRPRNVEAFVRGAGLGYPIGQDNGYRSWRNWNNRAWPAFYVLDRDGRIALLREGEGHAREMEATLRALLGLAPAAPHPGDDPDLSHIRTPEIYFGAQHPTPQERAQSPRRGEAAYAFPASGAPAMDHYALDGTWARDGEELALRSSRGGMRLRFSAAKLHLVAGAPQPAMLHLRVNGRAAGMIEVGPPRLYTLLDGDTAGEHLVEFETGTPGLTLYSATFG